MTNRRILFGIIAFGLLLRILFLVHECNNLSLAESFVVNGEVARNVLNGRGISINEDYMRQVTDLWHAQHRLIDLQDIPPPFVERLKPLYNDEPGYGLLLASIWKITGSRRWIYVRVLQVLIDLVMIGFVYAIGFRLGGVHVGVVAAFLYAAFVPGIELVVRPHRDIWVTFAYIASVLLLMKLNEKDERRKEILYAAVLGIATGLTTCMRSTIVVYCIACVLVLFVLKPPRRALLLSSIIIGVFVFPVSPLVIRNFETFNKIMITRGAFWHSFWAGIGQFHNPAGMIEDDQYISNYFRQLDSTAVYGTPRYEEVLRREALVLVQEHPLWYASTVVRRAGVILAPKIGRELFFQKTSIKADTGILNQKVSKMALLALDGLMVAGLLWGAWLVRLNWRILIIVSLPLSYTLVTLAPFYVVGRNIMNVYFVTLLFASISAVWLWQKVSGDHAAFDEQRAEATS